MDEQIVDLMRDQFRMIHDKIDFNHTSTNQKIEEVKEAVSSHVEEDRRYWSSIDEQKAQISLIKWLFSGASGSALMAWVFSKFGGR
jgi:hypothetical protein